MEPKTTSVVEQNQCFSKIHFLSLFRIKSNNDKIKTFFFVLHKSENIIWSLSEYFKWKQENIKDTECAI